VKDGLAVNDLMVERVRGLVSDRDLDGFVARAARDKADLCFALVALTGDGGGHGSSWLTGVRSGGDGFAFRGGESGLETSDVFAERTQFVGLLDLTRLLAQTKLKELLANFAKLGGELGRSEVADFFGSHDETF
jgi:hypothetical protein